GGDICLALFIIDNYLFLATNRNDHPNNHNFSEPESGLWSRAFYLISYLQGAARFKKDSRGLTSYYDGVRYGRENMLVKAFIPYLIRQHDRNGQINRDQLAIFLSDALTDFTNYQKQPAHNVNGDMVDAWGTQFLRQFGNNLPAVFQGKFDRRTFNKMIASLIRYLQDLIKIEDHFTDFEKNPIVAGHLLNKNMKIQVINFGGEGIHSETRVIAAIRETQRAINAGESDSQYSDIRLLRQFYANEHKIGYMGITKLCCAHCHLTVEKYSLPVIYEAPGYDQQLHTFHPVRGHHGNGYRWPVSDELLRDPLFLSHLLGDELFALYNTNAQLPDLNINGIAYSRASLSIACIEQICIFDGQQLRNLNPNFIGIARQKEEADGSINFSATPAQSGMISALFLIDENLIVREGEARYEEFITALGNGKIRAFQTLLPAPASNVVNEDQILDDEEMVEEELPPLEPPLPAQIGLPPPG
ncbi:MAG: hypothetical protein ACHP9Y_00780, partial [Gammaproteobacteria bacterium]